MTTKPQPFMSQQPPHVNHQDFEYQGKLYTLGHLNGFDVTYQTTDPKTNAPLTFDVRVLFDDHCYTSGVPQGDPYDQDAYVSETVREVRVFDPKRYQLSLSLPALVKNLLNLTCYFGDQDNFVTIDLTSGEKYNVYFAVSKVGKRGGLRLRIQSAYVRPRDDKLQKIKFGLILRNVRDNKVLKAPRR